LSNIDEIINGCKKGDKQSQEKLYRQFYPAFFALCKTFFSDSQDVITALNNGMLKVYKNIEQYELEKGSFFNWAYTIIRNTALTHIRNKNTQQLFKELGDDAYTVSFHPFENSSWDEVYTALDTLPYTTRAICVLFYIEEFLIKEIVNAMNMKEGTVKWHLAESRSRLKN
jgi:RNA polymerase sigma factor (sigma-70 family)